MIMYSSVSDTVVLYGFLKELTFFHKTLANDFSLDMFSFQFIFLMYVFISIGQTNQHYGTPQLILQYMRVRNSFH